MSKISIFSSTLPDGRSCLRKLDMWVWGREGGGKGKRRRRVLLNGEWQLVAARNVLNNNVTLLYTRCKERFASSVDEGGNNTGIPSGVDDGDTEMGAWIERGKAVR